MVVERGYAYLCIVINCASRRQLYHNPVLLPVTVEASICCILFSFELQLLMNSVVLDLVVLCLYRFAV